MGQVIFATEWQWKSYIATEWQWDRLYSDGVAVGQVIFATEWQWERLHCEGVAV